MSNEPTSSRKSFRDCSIFMAERSLQSIVDACGFDTLRKSPLQVLDAFSGQGIVADAVALHLQAANRDYVMSVAEINPRHLEKVVGSYKQICLDITRDPILGHYDVITVRYGLHDLSLEEKQNAIKNLACSLLHGGRIVISDIMPADTVKGWLEMHHQQKEILTHGPHNGICLASPDDYVSILQKQGICAEVQDSFYQEVFMRDWIGTFGAPADVVMALEALTMQAPREIRESLMIFNHQRNGARIYFPIVTLAGAKHA